MKEDYLRINAFIVILLISVGIGCKSKTEALPYFAVQGETMGTYYNIKYSDAQSRNLKRDIDSILVVINQSLSTYIPDSYISKINRSRKKEIQLDTDLHFMANHIASMKIYEATDGLFDPTVMPMVNYYGFGYADRVKRTDIPSNAIDSLKAIVGLNKIKIYQTGNNTTITKDSPDMQIDYSSIAKGYAVNVISEYLNQLGCDNHLVDIGGDGLARGLSPSNTSWVLGINKPIENAKINDFALTISISDIGLATSGNYRNFYQAGETKYAHTINPKTGTPEISTLLSTSVLAPDCMLADAYATACMVMGLESSQSYIEELPGVEACWIHDIDQDGTLEITYSSGFQAYTQSKN